MGHIERGIVVESECEWGEEQRWWWWGKGREGGPRGNQAGPVDNSTQTGSVRRRSSQHTHGSLSL